MPPQTRYARSGTVSIAYQVIGDGPFDLVLVPGFVSNVEYAWKEPSLVSLYEQLGAFCRLIVFDKRGTGLSDSKVAGIAVHTGARVASQAEPGEVLVSSTVKDLVAGSRIEFEPRGAHELKGIPGEWRLFAAVGAGA